MKSKLKAEIIGEFEANFLDGDKITDCGKCTLAIDEDFINFLDQVIDKAYSAGWKDKGEQVLKEMRKFNP